MTKALNRHKSWRLRLGVFACLAVMAFSLPMDALSQYWGRRRGRPDRRENSTYFNGDFGNECFTFCRVEYQSGGRGYGRGFDRWATDYPDSDRNFSIRLSELTNINVNHDENGVVKHAIVKLTDDELFHYPFIYMIEVGDLYFSQEEAERLREYLLKGGFLMVDDFWGSRDWENFAYEFNKVFPEDEYPIIDIPLEHEIFHIVFEIDQVYQIPGIGYWSGSGGDTSERGADSAEPHVRGVFDKAGRLMAVFCHNTDLGDGWEEEAVNPQYFAEYSKTKAYPLGINIVVYAMTH
ncbi:DUF4159 domain-containing protein [bacterium]|nr:DUF4159 domain-containing protein [bacterium]